MPPSVDVREQKCRLASHQAMRAAALAALPQDTATGYFLNRQACERNQNLVIRADKGSSIFKF